MEENIELYSSPLIEPQVKPAIHYSFFSKLCQYFRPERMGFFEPFPELVGVVVTLLVELQLIDLKTLMNLCCVNKTFRDVINHRASIWQALFREKGVNDLPEDSKLRIVYLTRFYFLPRLRHLKQQQEQIYMKEDDFCGGEDCRISANPKEHFAISCFGVSISGITECIGYLTFSCCLDKGFCCSCCVSMLETLYPAGAKTSAACVGGHCGIVVTPFALLCCIMHSINLSRSYYHNRRKSHYNSLSEKIKEYDDISAPEKVGMCEGDQKYISYQSVL